MHTHLLQKKVGGEQVQKMQLVFLNGCPGTFNVQVPSAGENVCLYGSDTLYAKPSLRDKISQIYILQKNDFLHPQPFGDFQNVSKKSAVLFHRLSAEKSIREFNNQLFGK